MVGFYCCNATVLSAVSMMELTSLSRYRSFLLACWMKSFLSLSRKKELYKLVAYYFWRHLGVCACKESWRFFGYG